MGSPENNSQGEILIEGIKLHQNQWCLVILFDIGGPDIEILCVMDV